jgi:hypothetical protein
VSRNASPNRRSGLGTKAIHFRGRMPRHLRQEVGLPKAQNIRDANNDHIPRHRSPLFIGQVDVGKLCVIRGTERELMPQRGAKLGNFGVTELNENETWVTDAEWMQTTGPNYADFTQCMKFGSNNAVFAARIQWKKANTTWNQR